MKGKNTKALIAPIVITIIVLLYLVFYFGFLFAALSGYLRYLLLILPLALAGVLIFVCIERIKEIKSGENDDLSKY